MENNFPNIRDRIVEERRRDIRDAGHTLGFSIPEQRIVPIIPFGRKPFIICEVKRRSPSKGEIAPGLDAVGQAGLYAGSGVLSISVLTEERYFGGTLSDLMSIKMQFPGLSVLRKDFLLSVQDISVSYRAGADAVLLIAGILPESDLREMYDRTVSLGMRALVEVHSPADVEKARAFKPRFVGINSRDLETFRLDPLLPLRIMHMIDWNPELVFESGIGSEEQARFAASSGFDGILVGEAVVRRPELIPELAAGLARGGRSKASPFFWKSLVERKREDGPLVKICGITCEEDLKTAEMLGADLLGFVLAPSPRKADLDFIRSTGRTDALKVAVVVGGIRQSSDTTPAWSANESRPIGKSGRTAAEVDGTGMIPVQSDGNIVRNAGNGQSSGKTTDRYELDRLGDLLASGVIDAVQFHGKESPRECYETAYPYYKAVGIDSEDDLSVAGTYLCPRILFDAKALCSYGGTGVRIPEYLARKAAASYPLWIAGGIGAENVYRLIMDLQPELIDASSRLEQSPGKKDPDRMNEFFKEIKRARS